MGSLPILHFAIFPFLAQGHIIPLVHLSRLLHRRGAAVTIFTTAANSPPIRAALTGTHVAVVELPFPQNAELGGVENTQKLENTSSFLPFAKSTKLMQKSFEAALQTLNPPVSCIISDAFLGFTLQSALKFSVPRLVFFGMGAFSSTMYQILGREKPYAVAKSPDESFPMTGFLDVELTSNDFEPPFNMVTPSGPLFNFFGEQLAAMAKSHGMIVNSFYEIERRYVDFWDQKIGPKSYCAGPLCAAVEAACTAEKPAHVRFLDEKLAEGKPVLNITPPTLLE